jgi:hypothetical protein
MHAATSHSARPAPNAVRYSHNKLPQALSAVHCRTMHLATMTRRHGNIAPTGARGVPVAHLQDNAMFIAVVCHMLVLQPGVQLDLVDSRCDFGSSSKLSHLRDTHVGDAYGTNPALQVQRMLGPGQASSCGWWPCSMKHTPTHSLSAADRRDA